VGRATHHHPAQAELGRRVQAERKRQGLSQMLLADRIGLHFGFISEVERGQRNLSLISLLRLAEGLGIDPAVLVTGLRFSPERIQPES
jgi:transcriptional regulator with XRE-family HTH domain